MRLRVLTLLAMVTAVALASLYSLLLYWLVTSGSLSGLSGVQSLILGSAVLRLVIVMLWKRARNSNFLVIIDFFSLEVLTVPFLAVVFYFYHYAFLPGLVQEVFLSWPSALLIALPVVAIYRLARSMGRGNTLTTVIPSGASLFSLLGFMVSTTSLANTVNGLTGLTEHFISSLTSAGPLKTSTPSVEVAGITFYVVMMVYAATRGGPVEQTVEFPLIFTVLASLVALVWVTSLSFLAITSQIIFGVPGMLMLVALWWVTRAR